MNNEQYQTLIHRDMERVRKFEAKLLANQISIERVPAIKRMMFNISFNVTTAQISSQNEIKEIKNQFLTTLNYMVQAWSDESLFYYGNESEPYFSLDQYWDILAMLCIGYLIEINLSDFEKLIRLRDMIKEKDQLLDFIINERSKREVNNHIMLGNPYKDLLSIIDLKEKKSIEDNLKQYLEKKWYKLNKKISWYDSHKSQNDIFYGYWSFESAAIVKIMDLEDSNFKDNEYYPYDLVHWK